MLKLVRETSVEEIKAVMRDVLLPAFVPGKANVIVTCAPIMEEVSPFPLRSMFIVVFLLPLSLVPVRGTC